MPNAGKLRTELVRKKRFIVERVIDFISNDPLLLEMAGNDPRFKDMHQSLLKWFPPELRLWAEDVVIGE